jgi:AraC family transcriptional regulator
MIRGTSIPGFKTILDTGNNFNKLVYSDIQSIELESTNIGISLKYVSSGVECYEIEGKEHPVHSGQFLLVNHQRSVKVQIHSKKVVEGICLYVDPFSLADYWASTQSGNRQLLDDPFQGLNKPFHCQEWVYPLAGSPLQSFIHSIHANKQQCPPFTPDFYYELSKRIVDHQEGTHVAIDRIKADKKSTREELYRRLLMAKSFIHDSLGKKMLIRDVARAACLSEFHFIRSFKQAFGITPNQYILQQKIEKAATLLRDRKYSISEVATLCGFSDHHYFSRCFKKIMGVPPSKFS